MRVRLDKSLGKYAHLFNVRTFAGRTPHEVVVSGVFHRYEIASVEVESSRQPALLTEAVVRRPVDADAVEIVDARRQALAESGCGAGGGTRIFDSDQSRPQRAAGCNMTAIQNFIRIY